MGCTLCTPEHAVICTQHSDLSLAKGHSDVALCIGDKSGVLGPISFFRFSFLELNYSELSCTLLRLLSHSIYSAGLMTESLHPRIISLNQLMFKCNFFGQNVQKIVVHNIRSCNICPCNSSEEDYNEIACICSFKNVYLISLNEPVMRLASVMIEKVLREI